MALFPMTSGLPSSTTDISRRSALRYAGAGVAGVSLSALLVACGGSSSTSEDADADTPQISPSASARTDFSGEVTFDNYEKKGTFVPATESAPAEMSEKVRRTERGLVITGVRHDNDWTLTIQDEYEAQASAQPQNGGANGGAANGGNAGNSGNGGNSNGDNL